MNEPENFALVPRPPGPLEKAAPGAKRILTDMIADALVKKDAAVKPAISVLVAVGVVDSYAEIFEMVLSDQYEVSVVAADNAVEVLRLAEQRPFDLFIVLLNQVWQGLDQIKLDPPDGEILGGRLSFLTRLKRQFGKPIIAMSGWGLLKDRVCRAGADVYFDMPFDALSIRSAVRSCLNLPATDHKPRPLRVVMVDDDPDLLEVYMEVLRETFGQAEFVPFVRPLKALEELEQRDPDLLITGIKMPQMDGFQLIERLFARRVQYPILVLTAFSPAKEWVKHYARRGHNIRFQQKPGSEPEVEEFKGLVGELLQPPLGSKEATTIITHPTEGDRRQRIVVVDDEEWMLQMVEIILANQNYRIETFQHPEIALQIFASDDSKPDLVITGMNMGRLNGFDVIEQARRVVPEQKILMMSGAGTVEIANRAHRLGVPFLSKPFTQEGLLGAVKSLLQDNSARHE